MELCIIWNIMHNMEYCSVLLMSCDPYYNTTYCFWLLIVLYTFNENEVEKSLMRSLRFWPCGKKKHSKIYCGKKTLQSGNPTIKHENLWIQMPEVRRGF